MNILKEYTLDYIKRNKKSSLAILIAVLISTTLLSALCGIVYTAYTDSIAATIHQIGNWHAELWADVSNDKLKYVTEHPNVETVLLKGSWESAQIDDPRRPYLVMRALTSSYWGAMPEGSALLEGRAPTAANELVLSKQYFEHHPHVKVGDTMVLPMAHRLQDGIAVDSRAPFYAGEVFVSHEARTPLWEKWIW